MNNPSEIINSSIFIDAGVAYFRLRSYGKNGLVLFDNTIPSSDNSDWLFESLVNGDLPVYITGKLSNLVRNKVKQGKVIMPSAVAWFAASNMILETGSESVRSLAIVELSASGYLIVGVNRDGSLKNDLLVVNPRCGAGSGVNLDRVIQKLGIAREKVDSILSRYAGEPGRMQRDLITIRADRCGVFSSSATISDKNQGIPLDVALATTLKSEVLKACRKLPAGFDKVCLTGRVFHWRFARECAEDYLHAMGVKDVICDPDNTIMLDSMRVMIKRIGSCIAQAEHRLESCSKTETYPSFEKLKKHHEAANHYLRLTDDPLRINSGAYHSGKSVLIGLDVGSTMAKIVVMDEHSGEILTLKAYSNSGDTIDTLKLAFLDLRSAGIESLSIRGIGITGSARFQVQQALEHIYPELAGRLSLLVENYAHARGSISLAREHVKRLKDYGIAHVNEDFCILVDIGGEDTKISTIALREAELFNNAMNLKCSAGTGSLMDTLSAMFSIPSVADANTEAFAAPQALVINATCAVFLMENARKLQVQGIPRDEILASANWAIVENMARTLWSQVDLPKNTVVLLHGQTMLSEPLPLAVTHRLQSYLNAPSYALVPPNPGHRACFGLINSLKQIAPEGGIDITLDKLLESKFEKRIIQCHGAACEDKSARCNRTSLSCRKEDGSKTSFSLGGCSAINELLGKQKDKTISKPVPDTYKEIWNFIDSHNPHSEDENRLVIPRSFAVSEWAFLFARIFEKLGIPVNVDNVRESDLTDAQPMFNIDSCAPHMGAVGQYRRLAGEPHGLILAPQIEFMPNNGKSLGRTCIMNQGGVAVAMNLANLVHRDAHFHLFSVDLSVLNADYLQAQLQGRLEPVFQHYGLAPNNTELRNVIECALEDHKRLHEELANFAAQLAEDALNQSIPVAVVVGREYILNPGIYDSHVRRLLRDKRMVVLPSYVLDIELDEDYKDIYWRNPHFIVSLLNAIAHRSLHNRLTHPRLREVFRRIESGPDLLPVVQVSTFSCGPDSVVQPFIAEIMKRRPFLLLQSDAAIKELAHLENRVNTYVKQLELGLHERLLLDATPRFEVRTLHDLNMDEPIDREKDVIYFPTCGDNRFLTSVLRGAGYTCIDNYSEDTFDLQRLVKKGRKSTGDAVCAPLAAVYADVELAVEDFAKRQLAHDPMVSGKQRVLCFDPTGTGPCRQGQYVHVHKLLHYSKLTDQQVINGSSCSAFPSQGILKFLVAKESVGYNFGIEEWVFTRMYMGTILQGVLHSILFSGGAACQDYDEYQQFVAEYRALKENILRTLESFVGPNVFYRFLLQTSGNNNSINLFLKYFAYGLNGRGLKSPLRKFARKWITGRKATNNTFHIAMTGEAYMRIAQAEEIFRLLLANLGFRRFHLDYVPVWSYVEYLIEERILIYQDELSRLPAASEDAHQEVHAKIQKARKLCHVMRNLIAKPLYRAAGVAIPPPVSHILHATKEVLPTLRPLSEIITYTGEAIEALKNGADIVLNVAPNGCMSASMGEVLSPAIMALNENGRGKIQHLFSSEGDINDELLTLSLLKAIGPENYYRSSVPDPLQAAQVQDMFK